MVTRGGAASHHKIDDTPCPYSAIWASHSYALHFCYNQVLGAKWMVWHQHVIEICSVDIKILGGFNSISLFMNSNIDTIFLHQEFKSNLCCFYWNKEDYGDLDIDMYVLKVDWW